ncbi:MAG: transcriptional regulator [Planctomycetota bacterium]|nr:MAG: transcriptional regulator [Planctomycetota bacterium]
MHIATSLTDDVVLEELGRRLAQKRLELGLTQARAATESGLSKRTIARMEAGAGAQLSSFVRYLRTLGLLDGLEALVPEQRVSPMELLRLKGRQRKRASSRRPKSPPVTDWTWGDDP